MEAVRYRVSLCICLFEVGAFMAAMKLHVDVVTGLREVQIRLYAKPVS